MAASIMVVDLVLIVDGGVEFLDLVPGPSLVGVDRGSILSREPSARLDKICSKERPSHT